MEETTPPNRAFTVRHCGREVTLRIRTDRYRHGGSLAVELVDASDGEDYATLSVNQEGVALADGEFVCKTYSENEGLLEELLRAGAVELTSRSTDLGPVCRLAGGE